MKNLLNKLFLFGILGSFVMLYSCGDDEEPVVMTDPPSVNIAVTGGTLNADQNALEAQIGSLLNFTVTVTAPGGFNTFRLTQVGNNTPINEQTRTDLNLDTGTTTAVITVPPFSFTGGQTATLEFLAVDDDARETTASVTVTLTSQTAEVRTAIILAAPLGDNSSKTFYSISRNELFSNSDVTGTADPVSEDIDLGYYYGSQQNASLASPAEYPSNIQDLSAWGTRNATNVVATTITSSAFAELSTVADVEGALENVDFSTSTGIVTNLSVGDVVAIETADGVQGLAVVSAITGTFNAGDSIELEFILAQEATN